MPVIYYDNNFNNYDLLVILHRDILVGNHVSNVHEVVNTYQSTGYNYFKPSVGNFMARILRWLETMSGFNCMSSTIIVLVFNPIHSIALHVPAERVTSSSIHCYIINKFLKLDHSYKAQ